MNTVVNIALVGFGGWLLYKYFKKREAELLARIETTKENVKTKVETLLDRVYDDPNADNWKSAG